MRMTWSGIFPNEASIIRLIGRKTCCTWNKMMMEWCSCAALWLHGRSKAMAELTAPASEAETRQIAA